MFLGGSISYKCIRMRLKVVVYVGQKPKTVVEITQLPLRPAGSTCRECEIVCRLPAEIPNEFVSACASRTLVSQIAPIRII